MGPQLEKIRDLVNKSLNVRLKGLKDLGVINTVSVNKRDILKARSRVQRKIGQSVNPPRECFQAISILAAVINLQHALGLLETQGVAPFNDYVARLRKKTTRAAKNILLDPNFSKAVYLAKEAEEYGLEHPKMKKLIELLKLELGIDGQTRLKSLRDEGSNKDSPKIIVFTQFRDTLDMIHERCEKEGIKSVRFYGQGTSDGKKGLTQKEQKNIIKSFKTGNYDVLISTSVAEEGIDIPAVDLVILYEPVPSEIRMIQRRGRTGRKSSGRMKVLITKKTIDEGYYWTSVRRESRKKEKSIVEDEVSSDLDDSLEEEISGEDIEEIDLENENESKLAEIREKEEKEQSLEDAIYEELAKNPQNQELVVYVDSREGNSKVIRALDTIGVKVKVNTMSVADYQVSEEVAIERKTAKDFVDSIVDKRLFKQARMMMEEFKKPIMILEGDDFYSGFINPNAIRGAMTSIALDYGISIIPTRTAEDTAAMIKRIAIREQKGEKRSIQIRTERKPQNLWEQQLFIIESLPNIGPVHAKRLLEHFGSVKAVLNADEKKLQEVEGIGKKTAKNIRDVVEGKYLYFKKDNNQKRLK